MMESMEITLDEKKILDGWRLVKKYRKGYLKVELKSDGTQFYLEATPAILGRVQENS